jgi:plastocyanin
MTHGVLASLLVMSLSAGVAGAQGQSAVTVTGNLSILDKGGKRATDVAQAVIWLEGPGLPAGRATRAEINTHSKQFLPRVLAVPVGSSVAFPNHDPFDHNVFSQSEAATFDLGLYGRGETRTAQFASPGIVRVYCNVHAAMSAYVLVQLGSHFTQPGADGSFTLAGVPSGSFTIHAWHERGGHQVLELEVEPRMSPVTMRLDASGWKPQKHLNKFGKPYAAEGRRY